MTYRRMHNYFMLRMRREWWNAMRLNALAELVFMHKTLLAPVNCYYDITGDMLIAPLDAFQVANAKEYLRVVEDAPEFIAYTVERSFYDRSTRRTF